MTVFLITVLLIGFFFLCVMVVDTHRFVIKEYTVKSNKLTAYRKVLVLSDLHGKSFGEQNQKLKTAIDKIGPDMILLAGDMYTACKDKDNSEVISFVSELAKNYPLYSANGNHEHKTKLAPEIYGPLYEKYTHGVKESGGVILVNESVTLPDENLTVYGLEIERPYYKKGTCPEMEEDHMTCLLGRPDETKFNLLIAHNPDYFEAYAKWGADLTVSGHVHGGLMVLPIVGGFINPRLQLFPKYDGGRFTHQDKTMILGRGLGGHTLPIRIFNPGELVLLHLEPGK